MTTPRIDSFRFGHIVIDGETYIKDVIITPEGVLPNWRRCEGHMLHVADLDVVFAGKPSMLVVGQGAVSRMRIAGEVLSAFEQAGIELVGLPTKDACTRYNELRERGDIAAALHLTC